MTKPIVKICYKLLYVATPWPQLISKLLVASACLHAASDWPRTFLHPRCFCLVTLLHAITQIIIQVTSVIVHIQM